MAVVAFSDTFAILESTGGARGIAGATLIGLSMESPSLLCVSAGLGCDSILAAVETPDGFGVAEGSCSESLPKKLAHCRRKNPEAPFLLFEPGSRKFAGDWCSGDNRGSQAG